MTITVKLTSIGMALIDDEDADLNLFRWCMVNGYAVRQDRLGQLPTWFRMHRVILARILGRDLLSDEYADHINRNKLDNRRANLRVASSAENAWNRPKPKHNTSGYKGVTSWKGRKWRASIMVHGKLHALGNFSTPEEAHEAYKKAAVEFFGEFANFGDDS